MHATDFSNDLLHERADYFVNPAVEATHKKLASCGRISSDVELLLGRNTAFVPTFLPKSARHTKADKESSSGRRTPCALVHTRLCVLCQPLRRPASI